MMELQQYDFEIVHRPGKENTNADALSRVHINYIGIDRSSKSLGKHREGCECNECLVNQSDDDEIALQLMIDEVKTTYPDEEWLDMEELRRREQQGMNCISAQTTVAILAAAKDIKKAKLWETMRNCAPNSPVIITTEELLKEYYTNYQNEDKEYDANDEDSDDESYISMESLISEKEKLDKAASSPIPWECCNEIICRCGDIYEPIDYPSDSDNYPQTTWDDFPNEDQFNDNWSNPANENEQEISTVWSLCTIAWNYTEVEIADMYANLIKEKWVVANQPERKGRMKCQDYCDTENHHLHKWYHICGKRIDWDMDHAPNCKFGIKLGQIHPDMNPIYLINNMFWDEPQAVIQENKNFFSQQNTTQETNTVERVNKRTHIEDDKHEQEQRHHQQIQEILAINQRHQAELEGRVTFRIPLIETQEKPHWKTFQTLLNFIKI